MIEHEVKLAFASVDEARAALEQAGARLVSPRRLQHDRLYDTPDGRLQTQGTTLRLRREDDRACVTLKGPCQAGGDVKSRDEIETGVASADTFEAILAGLGFRPSCRNEKYREEYALADTHVAIGVYVEIEGDPAAIAHTAALLGRSRLDYILGSYRSLYVTWCHTRGVVPGDMIFEKGR